MPSNVRDKLEQWLSRRLASGEPLVVSAEAMAEFARAGLRSELLAVPVSRMERGRKSARLVTLLADLARQSGHRANAIVTAGLAEPLLPEDPQADAELVALADLYRKLSLPQKAAAIASRFSSGWIYRCPEKSIQSDAGRKPTEAVIRDVLNGSLCLRRNPLAHMAAFCQFHPESSSSPAGHLRSRASV